MPFSRVAPVLHAALLAAGACLTTAGAQAPPSTPAPLGVDLAGYADVDSALARRDTAKALRLLQARGARGDAEAWLVRAAIGSRQLVAPWRRPKVITEDASNAAMWLAVEESLENATRLAPDSARYWLALARHRLRHRSGAAHHAGLASIDAALGAAHRTGGAQAFAITAFDAAMLFWRAWQQYDGRPDNSLSSWEVQNLVADREAPYPLTTRFRVADRPRVRLGEQELEQATTLLAIAADSAPELAILRRRHYAALASVAAWEELRSVAGRRARGAHGDFVDLLALALARHRVADVPGADSAFAAARRAMSAEERVRLTSITRTLSRADRVAFGVIEPADRDRVEERAWLLIDPLWSVPGNEIRNEYMARVAHAEVRWGSGVPGSGVDADPGTVWIGFGPPTVAHAQGEAGAVGSVIAVWRWRPSTQLQFTVPADGLEEQLLPGLRDRFDEVLARHGVSWKGVPGLDGLDSIAVQSALFRAGPDSADLFVAARVPTHRLSRAMTAHGALALDLFIVATDGMLVRRDSSRWSLDAAQRRAPAVRAWRHRLPRASYLHRVEAREPVSGAAARGGSMPATLDDASFRLDGFGVSQVLITEGVATRSGRADADRWSDYAIVPSPGDVHRDRKVSLLWELYGDGLTGLQRYKVEVTLQPPAQRVQRALGQQASTGIVGGAPRRTKSKDRVSISYERSHPVAARVHVEQVDLGAVQVSPGVYVLRVDVTDAATGRVATTSRLVTVQ